MSILGEMDIMSFQIIDSYARPVQANTVIKLGGDITISISTVFRNPDLAIFRGHTDITDKVFPPPIGPNVPPSKDNLIRALSFDYSVLDDDKE
jgi:hypothetical protein